MGKIAFVFSGQGDQYPGMGKELADRYASAARVFEMCDAIRPKTSWQCFEGSTEELKETNNTQPCLFAMELAGAAVLKEKGVVPNAVAGFSLGEVAAATVSGVFDEETGFRMVCKRGQLMQQEAVKQDTSMAAVIKLTSNQVESIAGMYPNVYPVNYNCPGQTSVSGLKEEMTEFAVKVKEEGGRAVFLKVQGAFHSPFMEEAAKGFEKELKQVTVKKPNITLYSNMTASPYTDDVVGLLSNQIKSPVLWENIICNMIDEGIDTFIEIGPGKTLTNMIKKINTKVKAVTMTEYLTEEDKW